MGEEGGDAGSVRGEASEKAIGARVKGDAPHVAVFGFCNPNVTGLPHTRYPRLAFRLCTAFVSASIAYLGRMAALQLPGDGKQASTSLTASSDSNLPSAYFELPNSGCTLQGIEF